MSIPPQRSIGQVVFRNTLFTLGSQLALRLTSFLFTVTIVNRLGGEQFGQYSIVIAWCGLFGFVGDLGVTQFYGREVARDRNSVRSMFWDVVSLRLILAVIATIITLAGAVIYAYETPILIGIAIYTFSYFLQAFLTPLVMILSGNERLDLTSMFEVIGQLTFIGIGALFLFAGLNFQWVIVASLLNMPILLLLSLRFLGRNKLLPPRFQIHPRTWWPLIVSGLPFGLIQLSLSFAYRVDTVLLSGQVSDYQVGLYNVAYGLVLTLLTFTRSFNNALSPTLTREHAADPENVRPWYHRSVKALLFLGLPIAVGGMLVSNKIVNLLYEPEIYPAFIALAILVWDIPFVMYQSFSGTFAKSISKEGGGARIYLSLALANLALNLFLIPRFGIIGSAFATVLTDMSGSFLFYFLLRRELGPGLGFKRLIRIPICGLLMGIVVYSLRDWHVLAIIPIGVITYLALIWLTGVFSPQERAQFTGFIQRRLQPRLHPG